MINIGIIFLIILLIILLIAAITAGVYAVYKNSQNKPIPPLAPCTPENAVNINSPDVLTCYNNNINNQCVPNNQYYIGQATNGKYDYVVSTFSSTPQDVCVSFCETYTANPLTCTGPNYNNLTALENYNNCIQQLTPTTCLPPLPLAINDQTNTLFYAFSPTICSCLNYNCESPCANSLSIKDCQ